MPQVSTKRIDRSTPSFTMPFPTVSIAQLLDITLCNIMFSTQTWNNASTIVQFILGTVMCVLVTAQFVRHSLQMYQATRKWQLNRYTSLLVRDSLLYFLVYVLPAPFFFSAGCSQKKIDSFDDTPSSPPSFIVSPTCSVSWASSPRDGSHKCSWLPPTFPYIPLPRGSL